MTRTSGLVAEQERVSRLARHLSDALSRDLLKRYRRDIEYDLVCRRPDRAQRVNI